jgi:tetratricopeptide (TPR) repeat protein
MVGRRLHLRLLLAVVPLLGLTAVIFWPRTHPPEPAAVESTPSTSAADLGFAGIDSCRACHASRVTEFEKTRHFQACMAPDVTRRHPGFQGTRATFSPQQGDVQFLMTQTAHGFFQTAIRKTSGGVERATSRMDLMYGSGIAADEAYFTWRGEELRELPMVWMHPQQEWGIRHIDVHGSGDFSKALTPRCLECHNTWFEHRTGTENHYRRDSFLYGVTCERCHGPARDHVAWHQLHPSDRRPTAIVRPATLSRERQIDVCAQCHSNAITYRRAPCTYRPGLPLDDFYRTLSPPNPEGDHVANQVRYMKLSLCFQKSESLTCTTCHDPHRPHAADDQPAAIRHCLTCHDRMACRERTRLPAEVQDRCIECHMPRTSKIQVRFDTQTTIGVAPVPRSEHRIGVYPRATHQTLLSWHRTQQTPTSRAEVARLTRSLASSWSEEGSRRRAEFRFAAATEAFRQSLALEPREAVRRQLREVEDVQKTILADLFEAAHFIETNEVPKAISLLETVLKRNGELGEVHSKLGTLYAATGRRDLALQHLRAAARDPDDPSPHAMLGWLDYLDGRPQAALEHYSRVIEIEPRRAKGHYNMALALLKLERLSDAERELRLVLELDPNHAEACRQLSRVLEQRGQSAEASRFAERADQLEMAQP